MKNVNPKEFSENYIKLMADDWMLISAGTKEKFNTMTASWGGIGYLWNKPIVFAVIRPERYTYEFLETNDCFTLSFLGEEYRKALALCGSKSGRDIDKIKESGLTAVFTESSLPTFKEARIVIECRKMYADMMKEEAFVDRENLDKWYGAKGGLHKVYVAEIMNIWVDESK